MLVYHGTHRDNLESILKNGLYGGGGYDPAHAATRSVDDPEISEGFHGSLGWLPADVIDFVSSLHNCGYEDMVVLEIDVTDLRVEEGWDGPGTLAIYETVAPDRIRVLPDEETWAVGTSVPVTDRPAWACK
jgi:hypothetical protein